MLLLLNIQSASSIINIGKWYQFTGVLFLRIIDSFILSGAVVIVVQYFFLASTILLYQNTFVYGIIASVIHFQHKVIV